MKNCNFISLIIIFCLIKNISICQNTKQINFESLDSASIINKVNNKTILIAITSPVCSGCVKALSAFFSELSPNKKITFLLISNECSDNYAKRLYYNEYKSLFPEFSIFFTQFMSKQFPFNKSDSKIILLTIDKENRILNKYNSELIFTDLSGYIAINNNLIDTIKGFINN